MPPPITTTIITSPVRQDILNMYPKRRSYQLHPTYVAEIESSERGCTNIVYSSPSRRSINVTVSSPRSPWTTGSRFTTTSKVKLSAHPIASNKYSLSDQITKATSNTAAKQVIERAKAICASPSVTASNRSSTPNRVMHTTSISYTNNCFHGIENPIYKINSTPSYNISHSYEVKPRSNFNDQLLFSRVQNLDSTTTTVCQPFAYNDRGVTFTEDIDQFLIQNESKKIELLQDIRCARNKIRNGHCYR